MNLATIRAAAAELMQRPRVKAALRWGRRGVAAAVLGLLVWQITQLGVGNVASSLPLNPAVYLLFVAIYLLVPVGETVFFSLCWQLSWRRVFLVFCRKHVYNMEVVDCAGEVYLYGWARENLGLSQREAFRAVKDNAILSSASANVVLLTMPAVAISLGLLSVEHFPAWVRQAFYVGPVIATGIMALLFLLRKKLLGLPGRMLLAGFGIHCGRLLAWMLLAAMQWWVALPNQSLQFVWTIIVVQQFSGRIPSMPFRDALGVSIGVGALQEMGGPTAQVAGVLLVNAFLDKLLNLALYSTSMFQKETPRMVQSLGESEVVVAAEATDVAGDESSSASRAA
ncbi:MAG: hypothetical protein AB7O62_19975 [Pirellulales bacterium]